MNKLTVDIGTSFLGVSPAKNLGLADLVSLVLSNAVAFAGIIMFILILVGGFAMIIGAGSDNPEAAAKGRKAATTALIGFLVVFATYWIIKIIETITGVQILNPNL